ncbi:REP-associated tyrosine transposase [Dokdonella soli]|uniref:Transposase IS200-like domain-containing protein n=1 Tax=Dokdonella soli TaxID=529810 RepID=A0ABN1ICE6_9GAMM
MQRPNYPPCGRARLRKGRTSEPGRIYLVTFTTVSRRRVFTQWEPAVAAIRALCDPSLWRNSRLLCWVLMPDHWHGLIELGATDSLSDLVRRVKGTTALAANRAVTGCTGPIWVSGFHDHAIRADEDVITLARYVVLNPVRAGLVTHSGLYPFWDAIWIDVREEHRGRSRSYRSKAFSRSQALRRSGFSRDAVGLYRFFTGLT